MTDGQELGEAHVTIVPDTSTFQGRLDTDLDRMRAAVDAQVNVDSRGLTQRLNAATAAASRSADAANVRTNVDSRGLTQRLNAATVAAARQAGDANIGTSVDASALSARMRAAVETASHDAPSANIGTHVDAAALRARVTAAVDAAGAAQRVRVDANTSALDTALKGSAVRGQSQFETMWNRFLSDQKKVGSDVSTEFDRQWHDYSQAADHATQDAYNSFRVNFAQKVIHDAAAAGSSSGRSFGDSFLNTATSTINNGAGAATGGGSANNGNGNGGSQNPFGGLIPGGRRATNPAAVTALATTAGIPAIAGLLYPLVGALTAAVPLIGGLAATLPFLSSAFTGLDKATTSVATSTTKYNTAAALTAQGYASGTLSLKGYTGAQQSVLELLGKQGVTWDSLSGSQQKNVVALSQNNKAMQSLSDSQKTEVQALVAEKGALDGLPPSAAKAMQAITGLKTEFAGIQKAVAPGIYSDIAVGAQVLTSALRPLEPLINATTDGLHEVGETLNVYFNSPFYKQFIKDLTGSVKDSIVGFAQAFINLGDGLAHIFDVFLKGGLGTSFTTWLDHITMSFDNWASSNKGKTELLNFMHTIENDWPTVEGILGSLFKIIGDLWHTFAGNPNALQGVQILLSSIAWFGGTAAGQAFLHLTAYAVLFDRLTRGLTALGRVAGITSLSGLLARFTGPSAIAQLGGAGSAAGASFGTRFAAAFKTGTTGALAGLYLAYIGNSIANSQPGGDTTAKQSEKIGSDAAGGFVAGLAIGGPYGAAFGAVIGAAIGLATDPNKNSILNKSLAGWKDILFGTTPAVPKGTSPTAAGVKAFNQTAAASTATKNKAGNGKNQSDPLVLAPPKNGILPSFWDSIYQGFFRNVATPIVKFFTVDLTHTLSSQAAAVGNAFRTAYEKFMTNFGSPVSRFITQSIPNFFTTSIPNWFKSVGSHFNSAVDHPISNFITVSIPNFFTESIPHWFSSFAGHFNSAISHPISTFITVTVPNFFTQGIPHWFDSFGSHFNSAVSHPVGNFITVTIPNFFTQSIPHWFSGVVTSFNADVTHPLQTFILSTVPNFFTQSVPKWFAGVVGFFETQVEHPLQVFVLQTLPNFFTSTVPKWFAGVVGFFETQVIHPLQVFVLQTLPNFFTSTIPHWFTGVVGFFETQVIHPLQVFVLQTLPNFFTTTIPKWFSTAEGFFKSQVLNPVENFVTVSIPGFFTKTIPNWFKSVAGYFKTDVITPVENFFTSTLPGAIEKAFKNSVNWVINNVINKLIGLVNDATKIVGIPAIKTVSNIAKGGLLTTAGVGYAGGGLLRGPGTGTSDSIAGIGPAGPIRVANGEYIVNAASTAANLNTLQTINHNPGKQYDANGVQKFGIGGIISDITGVAKDVGKGAAAALGDVVDDGIKFAFGHLAPAFSDLVKGPVDALMSKAGPKSDMPLRVGMYYPVDTVLGQLKDIFSASDNSQAGKAADAASVGGTADPGAILKYAIQISQGKPYVMGGVGPSDFDCSGLAQTAYSHFGVNIPRTSEAQWAAITKENASQALPGDLVFEDFNDGQASPGHVGLFAGPGRIWNAASPSEGIKYSQIQNLIGYGHFTRKSGLVGSNSSGSAGASTIIQGLALAREPAAWLSAMEELESKESGGNPAAVNSTAVDGQHATGLFQMLQSTFNQYAIAGHKNILNALDNTIASARYIDATYGNPNDIPGLTDGGNYQGYASGTTGAAPGWKMVGEKGTELMYSGGGETILNHTDTMKMMNGSGQKKLKGYASGTDITYSDGTIIPYPDINSSASLLTDISTIESDPSAAPAGELNRLLTYGAEHFGIGGTGSSSAKAAVTKAVASVSKSSGVNVNAIHGKLSGSTYTVGSGDTLSAIAAHYGTTVGKLAAANGIKNVNDIGIGEKINLSGSGSGGAAGIYKSTVSATVNAQLADVQKQITKDTSTVSKLTAAQSSARLEALYGATQRDRELATAEEKTDTTKLASAKKALAAATANDKTLTNDYNKIHAAAEAAAAKTKATIEASLAAVNAKLSAANTAGAGFAQTASATLGLGVDPATSGANFSSSTTQMKSLAKNIASLAQKGLNPALLQQILAMDPLTALSYTQQLLTPGYASISGLNSSYSAYAKEVTAFSGSTADSVFNKASLSKQAASLTAKAKKYAVGGIISEPIYGIGASGQTYEFGENGSEYVVPASAITAIGGGPTIGNVANSGGIVKMAPLNVNVEMDGTPVAAVAMQIVEENNTWILRAVGAGSGAVG